MDAQTVPVRLLFFAHARDRVGCADAAVRLPAAWTDQDQLLDHLVLQYAGLAELRPVLALALNEEYLLDRQPVQLRPDDVLALIPPISGG